MNDGFFGKNFGGISHCLDPEVTLSGGLQLGACSVGICPVPKHIRLQRDCVVLLCKYKWMLLLPR